MIQAIKNRKFYQKILAWREERIDHKAFLLQYGTAIAKLKGSHKGERCFIIGNGPSLLAEDLEAIKDEVTFASNFIFKMYDRTGWRPTYYCNSDLGVLMKMKDDPVFWNTQAKLNLFQYNARFVLKDGFPENSVCFYLREAKDYEKAPRFSVNAADELFDASTVTYIMLQLACYMGFREIYLLGIDHNYSTTVKPGANNIMNKVRNHFYSKEGQKDNDGGAVANMERMDLGFIAARKYARKHGIKIYNATRGGKLEVFERIDIKKLIDEVFNK